jgi:hypothetical protein
LIENLENIGAIAFSISILIVLTSIYTNRIKFKVKKLSQKILIAALVIKVVGTIVFCFYHQNIYQAGDTLHYHHDASLIGERILLNPSAAINSTFLDESLNSFSDPYFESGKYSYIGTKGYSSISLVRLTVFFELFSFRNFYACSILMSFFAFTGIWKIYELICLYFPNYKSSLSIILFIPSIIFWTGGILKDTIVLGSICWIVYSVFIIFKTKEYWHMNIFISLICLWLILLLKPYVLVILIPLILFSILLEFKKQIKDRMTSLLLTPILVGLVLSTGLLVMSSIQNELGAYGEYENLIERSELIRKGFDGTVQSGAVSIKNVQSNSLFGLVSVIGSVLFRPFIWESWSLISLFSSFENSIFLMVTIFSIISILFFPKSLKAVFKNPFLIFCILFSLTFTIALGLSVSNFGALMRFKTAFILFYVIPLIVVINESRTEYRNQDIKKGES